MYLLQDKRIWITLTKYLNDHAWLNAPIQSDRMVRVCIQLDPISIGSLSTQE